MFLQKLFQYFMPTVCILCRHPAKQPYDLCLPCQQKMPSLTHSCYQCANSLPVSESGMRCGECLQDPPAFDATHSLFLYEPPIPKLILDLKFHHAFTHAKLFAELLFKGIERENIHPALIIPVPLHNDRLRERGFNQAIEIARPLAKKLQLPLITRGIIRHKATYAQASLPSDLRKENIKNAFSTDMSFNNQHIVVVDDVITTGNTMREFCRLLKKQGAEKVTVLCCARRVLTITRDNKSPTLPLPIKSLAMASSG